MLIMDFNMVASCKYCVKDVRVSYGDSLMCCTCGESIHVSCLKRQATPGGIVGDIFYQFTCEECSETQTELFIREKMTWFQIIALAMFHLHHTTPGTAKCGFFHWKIHLVTFIDKKWNVLFRKDFKRRKNWMGTVSGSLSHFSPSFFTSGAKYLKEPGWWRLTFPKLTPGLMLLIYNELVAHKQLNLKNGKDVLNVKKIIFHYLPDALSQADEIIHHIKDEPMFDNTSICTLNDIDVVGDELNSGPFHTLSTSCAKLQHDCQVFDKINDIFYGKAFEIPKCEVKHVIRKKRVVRSKFQRLHSNFYDFWQKNVQIYRKVTDTKVVSLRCIEESVLRRYLNECEKDRQSHALKRKLVLRAEKREQNLSLLNVDKCMKARTEKKVFQKDRSLNYFNDTGVFVTNAAKKTNVDEIRLASGFSKDLSCITSPYTNRLLRPYIRQDSRPTAVWLQLMAELRLRVDPQSESFKLSTLDYCYVRPNHVPAINSLCEVHFWPGIDMAEALEYPDFSCVVLYEKLVVGFAFMVPDVKFNETYISFIFVRPEWRRTGIAKFMIYHLIQTCMGKDVTLHVAIDNPAIFLYQKFGFKVEEVVLNFYDTYLREDSKQCRHAFFLRLER